MEVAVVPAEAPCVSLVLDPALRVLAADGPVEAWTGRAAATLRGLPVHELFAPGARLFLETHCRPLLHAGGTVTEVALELVGPQDARRPVLLYARIAGDRVHVVLVEALQRQRYEQELRRMRDGARRARRDSDLQRDVAEAAVAARDARSLAVAVLAPLVRACGARHGSFVAFDPGGEPEVLAALPAGASGADPDVVLMVAYGAAAPAVHDALSAPGSAVVVLPLRVEDRLVAAIALEVPGDRPAVGLDVLGRCTSPCAQLLDRLHLVAELTRRSGGPGRSAPAAPPFV